MSGLEGNCREASGDCDWQQGTHKVGFGGCGNFLNVHVNVTGTGYRARVRR